MGAFRLLDPVERRLPRLSRIQYLHVSTPMPALCHLE
jgi:hypothetical protein